MTPKHPRPTAPHLQVYKLPLTAIISISHRITGVFLVAGLVIAIVLLIVIAQGESAYLAMQQAAEFWLAKCLLLGFIFALFFHLCHGVRHLFWDFGSGFQPAELYRYAMVELSVALALTLCAWVYLL
jgi:succinate dehydrogenase / fumarate reductase, cytochrome b subunit